jgi:hypothetical protein
VYEVSERLFLRRLHPDRIPATHAWQHWHGVRSGQHVGRRQGWRVFRDMLGAVQRAPLSRPQRWACYLPVMHWLRRSGQEYLRDRGRDWSQWLLAHLPLRQAGEHFDGPSTLPGVRH